MSQESDELAAVRKREAEQRQRIEALALIANDLDPEVTVEYRRHVGEIVHGDYRKRGPADVRVDPAAFADDELGNARLRLALVDERADWLADRVASLQALGRARQAEQRTATLGIGRFVADGRYSLDELAAATDNPHGRAQVRGQWDELKRLKREEERELRKYDTTGAEV